MPAQLPKQWASPAMFSPRISMPIAAMSDASTLTGQVFAVSPSRGHQGAMPRIGGIGLGGCLSCQFGRSGPSVLLENRSTVKPEATEHGNPLVVAPFGGTREAVEAAACGFVVSPFGVPFMANYLEGLSNQPELSGRLGLGERRAVQKSPKPDRSVICYLAQKRTCANPQRTQRARA